MARADDLIAEICRQATEMVREAVAEALIPYGQLREEWGVRFPDNEIEIADGEDDARTDAANDAGLVLVRRDVTRWRPAADGPQGELSATETADDATVATGTRTDVREAHGEAQEPGDSLTAAREHIAALRANGHEPAGWLADLADGNGVQLKPLATPLRDGGGQDAATEAER